MEFPRIRRSVLAVAALALAAAPALAQDPTVYGNQTEYDAAAGASDFCLDFDGSPNSLVSGASFSADVTFGSPEAEDPTQVNWSSDAISDAGSTTDPVSVGPLDGTFTGTAMAFRFVLSSAASAPTVELYAEDSSLIATVNAPSAAGFFGVISSVPVKRFVVVNGFFEGTTNRDRFFIDDFCVTAVVDTGGGGGPDLAALLAQCEELDEAVAAADPSAFRRANRQRTLGRKLDVVCRKIEAGNLCAALQKLRHDVLPKTDGEGAPADWVTDAAVQQDLEDRINALIAALEEAGGCTGDDDADDDDGDDGPSANGRAHGRGHNK
jgi:hypothetical protein